MRRRIKAVQCLVLDGVRPRGVGKAIDEGEYERASRRREGIINRVTKGSWESWNKRTQTQRALEGKQ